MIHSDGMMVTFYAPLLNFVQSELKVSPAREINITKLNYKNLVWILAASTADQDDSAKAGDITWQPSQHIDYFSLTREMHCGNTRG